MRLTDQELIDAFRSGKHIRQKSRPSQKYVWVVGCVSLVDNDGFPDWDARGGIVYFDSMIADDWEIVEND